MSGRWFRFYDEVADDPKVQRLSDAVFKAWINIMCIASRHNGRLPPNADLAFSLRIDTKRLEAVLSALMQAGLVDEDEDGLLPHNWNGRQYKSDVSTERVRSFRKRRGNVSETASETPPDTEQNRAEQKQGARAQGSENDASELNKLNRILGLDENDYVKFQANLRILIELKTEGCDFERHIWPAAEQAARTGKARGLAYIGPRARELRDAEKVVKSLPIPFEDGTLQDWRDRYRVWCEHGKWSPKWGPKPGEPGCKIPPEILAERNAA